MLTLPTTLVSLLSFIAVVLGGVIVYLNRKLDIKDKTIQDLQTARLQDFKDREDKLVVPMELMARNTESIYNKMINGNK